MILYIFQLLVLGPALTVSVSGIEEAKGQVVVAVYNSKEAFMDEQQLFTYKFIDVKEPGELSFTLDLPPGEYALSLYHDINGDQSLNTNLVGMPREPYGFSNNARALFSAPEYDAAIIDVTGDTRISIVLK